MNSACSFNAESFIFQRYSRTHTNLKITKPHLVSQHVTAATVTVRVRSPESRRAAGGKGCLGQVPGKQRDHFYPSLRATDGKAACVLPETRMLAHARGCVVWVDTGSGSTLFLLIIIYFTVIPSPSSF